MLQTLHTAGISGPSLLASLMEGFPALPSHTVDSTTLGRLQADVAFWKAEHANTTQYAQDTEAARASAEAAHKQVCVRYQATLEAVQSEHALFVLELNAQHRHEMDARKLEISNAEAKHQSLEGIIAEMSSKLLELTAKEVGARGKVVSLDIEVAALQSRNQLLLQRIELLATAPQCQQEPDGFDPIEAAAKVLNSATLRRMELETTYNRQQWETEYSRRTSLEETLAALRTSHIQELAAAGEGRQAALASFLEEAKAERELLIQDKARAVGSAVATAVAEQARGHKTEMQIKTAQWEERLELLKTEKLAGEKKSQEQLLLTGAQLDSAKEALASTKLALEKSNLQVKQLVRQCTVQKIRGARLTLLVFSLQQRLNSANASAVEQQSQMLGRIAKLEQQIVVEIQGRTQASSRVTALEDMHTALMDRMLAFKRAAVVEYMSKSSVLASTLSGQEAACHELETQKSECTTRLMELEGAVRQMETELSQLSQLSSMKPDGQVDVALARKKRRMTSECEAMLGRVASGRVECVMISNRLVKAEAERRDTVEAISAMDSALLKIILEQQKSILQLVQSVPSAPAALPAVPVRKSRHAGKQ